MIQELGLGEMGFAQLILALLNEQLAAAARELDGARTARRSCAAWETDLQLRLANLLLKLGHLLRGDLPSTIEYDTRATQR